MDDIVYLAKAVRSQNLRIKLTDDLRKKISSWNHADVLLYKHFNATFWRKLEEDYGQTLQSDLALFRSKLTGAVGTGLSRMEGLCERSGNGIGTGWGWGRAHPFEISPPPPGCLERVR